MKIDVIISADDIKEEKIVGKSVVVIDMLRATSTIVTAISNGCKEIIPVLTIEEARELSKIKRKKYILGGERRALKIDGFDCSNSPLEYIKEVVKDKTLILTTSNGTKAIKRCMKADKILIGSMLNARSVANRLSEDGKDIVIVNAGTAGEFSLDDFICGGYIIECIKESRKDVKLSDIASAANYMYKTNEKDVLSVLKMAKHYDRIVELGLQDDLKHCIEKDIYDIVPEYKEGKITV